jgi:NAD(P)-dependent dehydrogenase (short-subunit alcohol dehydrogenase family)
MRILLIGATGTIGGAVAEALSKLHEVVPVGHSKGDLRVDLASKSSIEALFNAAGPFDAVVSCAGIAPFGAAQELTDDDYVLGLSNKLMGQINLVRCGAHRISEGGVFVLTSGAFATQPIQGTAAISIANAGVDAFARAASLDLAPLRVCSVSPVFVKETAERLGVDATNAVSAADTSKAYLAALEGEMTGVLDVRDYA